MASAGQTQGQGQGISNGIPPASLSRQESISSTDTPVREGLTRGNILAYGFGHFYNDLCACMWFVYLLIFYERAMNFSRTYAGGLMLLGQVTDGLATPLVGIVSDKLRLPRFMVVYGRRKSFHLIGTILVTFSFPLLFGKCYLFSDSTSELLRALYYAPFIILFQTGWAIVQISHLSLIPELAMCEETRTTLNSIRYGFTVVAQLIVFGMVFAFLGFSDTQDSKISSHDIKAFLNIDLLVVCIGCYFCAAFHFGVTESRTSRRLISESISSTVEGPPTPQHCVSRDPKHPILPKMCWKHWFKEHQFYQVALLYMLSRLYINVTQIYLTFYITYTQNFNKKYVGIFPMVIALTSFFVSSFMSLRIINQYLNRKCSYFVGIVIGVGACGWMWVDHLDKQMYGVLVLMGIGQAVLLVTSLAFTADLINRNSESGAFVYGAMSFMDKIANGFTCMAIQAIGPHCPHEGGHHLTCSQFYRDVMVFVPSVSLGFAAIILLTLLPQKIGARRANSCRVLLVNEE